MMLSKLSVQSTVKIRAVHIEYLFVMSQPSYITFAVCILQAKIPCFSQSERPTC